MLTATGSKADFEIRFAQEKDIAAILGMISQLAEYEKMLDQVKVTEQLLNEAIFKRRAAEAIIGERCGEPVAYAIFYPVFGSFSGKTGLFIEDLYVKADIRRRGLGKALFAFVAKIAVERGYKRLMWTVLDWNEPSKAFYRRMGAEVTSEPWLLCKLSGKSLKALAREKV